MLDLAEGLLHEVQWMLSGHGTPNDSACPHYSAAHEDEVHVFWDCPGSEGARETWRPWLSDAAIPKLGMLEQRPAGLRKAGLPPPLG